MNYEKFVDLYGQFSADLSILPPFGFIVFFYDPNNKNVCNNFTNVLSIQTKCEAQEWGVSLLKPVLDLLRNDGLNDYTFGSRIFTFYLKDLDMALDPNLKELCKYAKQLKVRVLLFVDKTEKWARRTDLLSWGDIKITADIFNDKPFFLTEIGPRKKGDEISTYLLDITRLIDEEKKENENEFT